MIERSLIFNHLFSWVILFPVIISFVFRMIGLPVPSYLFLIIITSLIIVSISNSVFTISKSWAKVFLYLFFAWVLFSISYTPSIVASKEKFIAIVYNTLLPIFILEAFFLFAKKKNIDLKTLEPTVLKYAFYLLFFVLIAYALFRQADVGNRQSIPGVDNAIWFSRFVGMLLLIILCLVKLKMNNLMLYLISIFIALIMLFGAGSRGPMLSVLIVFFVKQSYLIPRRKLILLLIVIASVIAFGFLFIGGYMFETNFYSLSSRFDLIKLFQGIDFDYLKGSGIGSYSVSFFGIDEIYYPHNVFLELFFENGLVGVFLFCILLYFFFKSFQPNIVNFLCLYYFLASLVSGDIPGNNNFFILLFLSIYAKENTLTSMKNNAVSKNEINLKYE